MNTTSVTQEQHESVVKVSLINLGQVIDGLKTLNDQDLIEVIEALEWCKNKLGQS